jgi:two-component system LytT family response regulator
MALPVFIRKDKKLLKIDPTQIVFLVADKNYTRIFMYDRTEYLVRSSLLNAYKKLPAGLFVRTHRSYVISVMYIDEIYKDYAVVAVNMSVPVAKQYFKNLTTKINIIE